MPRPLFLLLAVLLSATVHGQEAKKPSPAVTRILDEAVRAVKRNRVDFDKANQKPLGEARKALDELSTKLIKDGKADEAAAVLRQVGTLEADVMRMANAPPPVPGGAVAQKPLLERLAGRWAHPNDKAFYAIQPDGAIQQGNKGDGKVFRQGVLQLSADGSAEVAMDGMRFKVREAGPDTIAIEMWDSAGKPGLLGVVLTRIK